MMMSDWHTIFGSQSFRQSLMLTKWVCVLDPEGPPQDVTLEAMSSQSIKVTWKVHNTVSTHELSQVHRSRLFMDHHHNFPSGSSETPPEWNDQRLSGVPQGALSEREPPVHLSEHGEHR